MGLNTTQRKQQRADTMKEPEQTHIRKILADKLGIDKFYWYPLTTDSKPDNAEFFETNTFQEKFGLDKLIEMINFFGDTLINSLTETGENIKINTSDLEPYCGLEVIYCNNTADWAIYFSHENTVTFIGQKIIDELKKQWPNFDKYKDPWGTTK